MKIHIEFNNIEDCLILAPSHYVKIDECIVSYDKYEMLYIDNKTYNNYI